MSDTAKSINLLHVIKVGSDMTSSQKVSQSVPQSGLSPVLAKYKQYLQSCYNARDLAPADKYLPTLESPYIKLAMIRRGRYNHEQRDEFTRRTLHGGVDQILENKTSINIEDLLTPEDSGRPVRFILVEGPPGIGKSTFAWEVCRIWDEIENLRDYHTVVLLKLREKWVLNATSLSDLFRYPSDPDFSNSIAEQLVKSQGKKLLFVLDGFDEVSHSFHENSVIKSILCRELLPECTIILTTRPVAKATLRSICQPRVDKHVEIIGFTEEERVRYITEVFSKEPELQENFLKYMFLVPHIQSMMYIPLNCAIIAQVYYESQSSHHLAIPRTRTQLYKALTHSLLVRHMKTKEGNYECLSMLPEGLEEDNSKRFKTLAKFAFDTYHKGESRKVTFFKEDIPEGLVHFGFMNVSTEIYADKGVEQTLSFLHLSLQEYLAAWHLADSYSIEFQVAYHAQAVESITDSFFDSDSKKYVYKGDNKEEAALISSLEQQESSLVEPAIFLAGITGWRCQSEDDRNPWEMYLSLKTVTKGVDSVLLRSLYEAQNPTLFSNYFTVGCNSRKKIIIGSVQKEIIFESITDTNPHTPYDCYALSYCLAHQLHYSLSFGFNEDNDIPLVKTFIKGLGDHCLTTTPRVKHLIIEKSSSSLVDRGLLWLMKANFLSTVEESVLDNTIVNNSGAQKFLSYLVNLQSLKVYDEHEQLHRTPLTPITSWEWLAGLKSLSELKVLHISSSEECSPPPTDIHSWLEHGLIEGDNKLTEVVLDIKFPSNTIYDIPSPTDVLVDSVLKSVLRSNQITKMVLPHVAHETMTGVYNILLHCPSLTTLELKRTRLGYDGILYICSALRNNTTLTHFAIHDELQLSQSSDEALSRDDAIFPGKTTCNDFLLELIDIVKHNTLEEMNIQTDLLSTSEQIIFDLELHNKSSDFVHDVLQTMAKAQLLKNVRYFKWLAESHEYLQVRLISNNPNAVHHPIWSIPHKTYNWNSVTLSNISRETMADVRYILLRCPSLTTLELKKTRLGYDGILYICSALRNNTTLKRLMIHDLQLPPYRYSYRKVPSFSSMERVPLPDKTTCTDFLLELNNILKNNTTLEKMKIQSELFLPLSAGEWEYCQWTGLGSLQQFNVGAVGSGMSPNLRRSFSSSDLTQPQTTLFWGKQFPSSRQWGFFCLSSHQNEVDFKKLFSKRKEKGKKLFSLPSFTAPDTEVLQSFSGLDPRLKECLEISHLHQYVERLRETCWEMLRELKYSPHL